MHTYVLYISIHLGICQCLQEGRWVSEEPYEVQGVNIGDSVILAQAPRKGRLRRIWQVLISADLILQSLVIE